MKKSKKKEEVQQNSKIELWLEQRSDVVFYGLLAVFVVFSLLYFNARLSIAGDDSSYITRAINFWDAGKFPTYQAPLYPIFLSLLVGIVGLNVLVLKFASLLLMVGFIVLFYRSLKGSVSYVGLFFTIAVLSVSHYFLFFSSQTFSEPLFMVFQAMLFLFFFRWIEANTADSWKPDKRELKYILIVSVLSFLLFITRTIGFGALLALLVYFVISRNYKRAVYITVCFVVLMGMFLIVRSAVWDVSIKSGEQTSQLLNKNPYQDSEGKEDVIGFLNRFKDNSNLYLSKHFMRFVGLRSGSVNTIYPMITILLYLLFAFSFFWFFKTNKFLFLIAVYLAIMLGITFFSLQKLWDQYRLIVPFLPYMVILFASGLIYLGQMKSNAKLGKILPVIFVVMLAAVLGRGIKTIDIPVLAKNIKGDKYAGFTPDWQSYLSMAEYSKHELSTESYVACRKPNMARIYGKGKKFYGIYRIPSQDADKLVEELKKRGVTHVIMGSLRKNPYIYTGQTINTVQRYMSVIVKKYPKAFVLEKKYGNNEPAYLFRIEYANCNAKENEIE
ncbi:glycosyltransferase family 39 protein [Labilibacter sediminis]|nr:glycosyltransferase family 39 protein [Labilibacter sediminis]